MLWERFMGPSLKAVRTLPTRPIHSYGNTASLSYPDTWVRKPDCLHLPYTPIFSFKFYLFILFFHHHLSPHILFHLHPFQLPQL